MGEGEKSQDLAALAFWGQKADAFEVTNFLCRAAGDVDKRAIVTHVANVTGMGDFIVQFAGSDNRVDYSGEWQRISYAQPAIGDGWGYLLYQVLLHSPITAVALAEFRLIPRDATVRPLGPELIDT